MARKRIMRIGGVNIKTHPHSEDNYKKLFIDAFSSGRGMKIRGSTWGMIGSLQEDVDDGKVILYGTIYKFLNIDPKEPWLNTETKEPVMDENGQIVQPVSENLKPHLKEIYYVFYPKGHRMFFESDILSPSMAKQLMDALLGQEKIRKKYGYVDIEIETSSEIIEKILAIPILSKLEIRISKPNPGDVLDEDDEAKVFKRFEKVKARKLNEQWTGEKKDGLDPDEDIKTLMRVASSNGQVNAEGYGGDDQKVTESTQDHPRIFKDKYDPDVQLGQSFFKHLASRMYSNLTRK